MHSNFGGESKLIANERPIVVQGWSEAKSLMREQRKSDDQSFRECVNKEKLFCTSVIRVSNYSA